MRSSLLLIGSAALLVGCSSNESRTASAPGANGGTLVFSLFGNAISIFPPSVVDVVGRLVQDQVFDRLAEIDQNVTTVGDKGFTPRLARKWTWAPDSLSIAFSLDPRARWHDGKPVTASDVRFSLDIIKDTAFQSPLASLVTNLDSVHVQDSLTAVVFFKKHTPEQFYDAAYQVIIIPKHVYAGISGKDMRTAPAARSPIGSGQFRFVKWEQGSLIELIADTANYRGRPKVDRVILQMGSDPAAAEVKLLASQSDLAENLPLDHLPLLDTSSIVRPMFPPGFGYVLVGLNQHDPKAMTSPHPIFADLRTRRALSMALDRAAMLKNVFGASGKLSHGPFPASAPFADTSLHPPAYDTVAAKAMLDSSGWRAGANGMRAKNGRPLRFTLLVSTSAPRRAYAVLIQDQLKKVGARVDVEVLDNNTLTARANKQDFDAIVNAFVYDPSPTGVLQAWGATGIGPDGQNFLHYNNPRVDALLDTATTSFDPAAMKRYTSRAFQTIIDDAPAIFLYDMQVLFGVSKRVTLAPLRVDEWWANLADWSIPLDKRLDRDRIGLTPAKR
jgi:peptide/nickel transport system substrate-binding protein